MTVEVKTSNYYATARDLSTQELDLLKSTICKGSSDLEFKLFADICKRTGLDPFTKQIYAIKRGNQMTIQTGIDGLRLIAERTGRYSPGKESYFAYDNSGNLLSATSYVKKRTDDGTWHEVAAIAYLEEYNAKQGLWSKMPRAMLSKCAESLALRKAFPAEMSGLYSHEEMDQAGEGYKDKQQDQKKTTYLNDIVGVSKFISEEQSENLKNLGKILNDRDFLVAMLAHMNVDAIEKIPSNEYQFVEKWLRTKIQKKQEAEPIQEEVNAG